MQGTVVRLVKRPVGDIQPDIFALETVATAPLQAGEFLVRHTHMSLDPAMRTWLFESEDSYAEPVRIGEIMRSFGIGVVVESRNSAFPVGARVLGMTGWAEYVPGSPEMQIIPDDLPAEAVLSVLYVPGLTAYLGLVEIARCQPGETLVISGAAGSVGSLAGQIGRILGLRVIGFAGSGEKCHWLEIELGFDRAINYRSENIEAALDGAAPDGVDVYFENTGGPVQQVVFDRMNRLGRIAVCGVISDYNRETPAPGPSWLQVNLKALTIQGFVLSDHMDKIPAMTEVLGRYLADGKLHYRTHVLQGLENAIDGINLLFTGGNTGKLIVEL